MKKTVHVLGTEEIQNRRGCGLLTYNFSSRNKTNKQAKKPTNKQSNLLNLTASCEKRNCLISSKKKSTKSKIK